ncbi:unnamed protein product, partial [Meganyctiphanes norvegica]
MGAVQKGLCFIIMLMQMCAILSGVALMYGSVIVIIPSKDELLLDFNSTPIMCTTQRVVDIMEELTPNGEKPECKWLSCGEWCLSKGGPCIQISVMARQNGSNMAFKECEVNPMDEDCSALDYEITSAYDCNDAQCKDLTGVYNCSKKE